ncbi:MAG: ABC transporter permease [Ekhidna sp.]
MKHPDLPSFAYRLFKWFCKKPIFEELEGDLEETFLLNKEKYGLKKARRIYTKEVLKMIRPTVISKPTSGPGYQAALLGSYVTISLRNLIRHKLFSFINIFSLSIAMSTGLLVIGMITDLLKFDEFHEHKEEVYRVTSSPIYQGRDFDERATSPLLLAQEMAAQVPGIQITQLGRKLSGLSEANDKKLQASGIYADEHFFDFLTFNLLRGNAADALKDPFSVVISTSFAQKVFEGLEPIGETLTIEGVGTFIITGIVADPPKFSHIQFEIIGSLSTVHMLAKQGLIHESHDDWTTMDNYYNYIYIPGNLEKASVLNWLNVSAPSYYKNPDEFTSSFALQRLNQILPGKDLSDQIGPKMMFLPIIILSGVAIAILLSAIFNYTNLSMARALRRAREVGVRKLNGANSWAVYLQFTVEAIVLSMFSLGLGILLFLFLRPGFLDVIPRASEVLKLELTGSLVFWFGCFALVTGLIAGMAPSVFFSKLSSLKALRGGGSLKALSRINFRKGLIIAQFTLSIIFILALVITNKQYSFSINHQMGFDKENILNISLEGNDPQLLKTELIKLPEVSAVSFSSLIPGAGSRHNLLMVDSRNQDSVYVSTMSVDHTYISTLGIELVAGRPFRPEENKSKETSIIINETFVKNFGLESPSDALGKVFTVGGNTVEIIGVVKDFHYSNLEDPILSFVFRNNAYFNHAVVKLSTSDILATIDRIEDAWTAVDPSTTLNANFFDEYIKDYYQFLIDIMKMFGFIGFLAISISSLGLFGMAIYSTEIRMKEIGVRKTFGASEKALIVLLSKGFLKLVFWGALIGTPICYLLFDKVILAQGYYRTDITFFEISISILFLLIICFLAIISQTWNAARTNPATVLKDE